MHLLNVIKEEKRTLERELARVKVSANRVATVVANEWKDENDKVMPIKQWLEQRRLLQVFSLVNVIVHQIFSISKFRKNTINARKSNFFVTML